MPCLSVVSYLVSEVTFQRYTRRAKAGAAARTFYAVIGEEPPEPN